MEISITIVIIAATSLISIYAFGNSELMNRWIFSPYLISKRREYHRFLTSGLLHANFIHLIFNMFMLYIFGQQIEGVYAGIFGPSGRWMFLGMYALSIIVVDIPSYFKHKDHSHYMALGASGGVSAILFSFILFAPTQDLCLYGLLCFPGVIWGALYIVYSIYMGKRNVDNVNHSAHLFGGLFGVAFTIVVYPEIVVHFFSSLSELSVF